MLRREFHCFAVCSVALALAGAPRSAVATDRIEIDDIEPAEKSTDAPGDDRKPEAAIRQLKAAPALDFLGEFANSVLTTAEEIEKFAGKAAAEQLATQVDLQKESIVAFGYQTSGPPFGVAKGERRKEGDKEWIEFFVEEPGAGVRGQAAKIGRDFFAVPKGVEVKFTGVRNLPPRGNAPRLGQPRNAPLPRGLVPR